MGTVKALKGYYATIQKLLTKAKTDIELFEEIVNAPFHNKLHATTLDLGMIVMVQTNQKTATIDRIAYSKTQPSFDAIEASDREFTKIKIPLKDKKNITARAIRNKKHYQTSDWHYLFVPVISPEAARFKQAESGMGCSIVYPLTGARGGGALIFSFYQTIDMINSQHHAFMQNYTNLVTARLNNTL